MKTLFSQTDAFGIMQRIEKLPADSPRLWGKMAIAQMLAHCNASLETAMGRNHPAKLPFGIRLIGKMMKPGFFSEKPFPKNAQTDKTYLISDARDFDLEKKRAISLIQVFSSSGPAGCRTEPHVFFGKLTPDEWAFMQWKHFDHHLKQFAA